MYFELKKAVLITCDYLYLIVCYAIIALKGGDKIEKSLRKPNRQLDRYHK